MNGVSVDFDNTKNYVELTLSPAEFDNEINAKALCSSLREGQYKSLYISESTVKAACDKANHFFKTQDGTQVTERIGERRNAEVEFRIPEDGMSASLVLTAPFGGKMPTAETILALANKNGIRRGVSIKRITALLEESAKGTPGNIVEREIARGLPPRDGKSSRFIPLVPNALERVLRPQSNDGKRVDMRNLGEVICVKANTEVLRRTPPTQGRNGFDVRGNGLEAKPGDWVEFKKGEGTVVSDHDENLLIAAIAGMPKYQELTMNIDDTYICSGVNVGTGHINYEGAVLVNGDVTEKMVIKATGDVTVNGFVESARIESGGDIIITEGGMGKVNETQTDYSCQLIAAGSVHVQHGQGLDIQCAGNITVGRQLAYSKLRCGGSVTVGQIDNPQGNLFACDVVSQAAVTAGTLGAVSGSTLKVDFSPGFNLIVERKDALDELLKQLRENNLRHQEKISIIQAKFVPKEMREKVQEAKELLKNESALLSWIEDKAKEMKTAKDSYQTEVKLVANKRLYPGVSVKLNNRTWRSEREYDRSRVKYDAHQWHFEPIVN
ncbi:FapA family protein [Alteromonas sp. ASW11-19]|uniref:FapA family protein n=1 Tax=Alteromonas salexigens TaxID=2982530 RepID=A0ABT2VKV5_9ALTE|nr:FapA family protein [Alteromonas salexigens]MCU7553932.1 FapA family protein [Alteromonas salexigens]